MSFEVKFVKLIHKIGISELYVDCEVDINAHSIVIDDSNGIHVKYYSDLTSYTIGLEANRKELSNCINIGQRIHTVSDLKSICESIKKSNIELFEVLPVFKELTNSRNCYVFDNYVVDDAKKTITFQHRLLASSKKHKTGDLKSLEINFDDIASIPSEYDQYSILVPKSCLNTDKANLSDIMIVSSIIDDYEFYMKEDIAIGDIGDFDENSLFKKYMISIVLYII